MGKTVAFFISPHGFGHAARACSIIQAFSAAADSYKCIIATSVPHWFFDASLEFPFDYYYLQTDIGLVQSDPISIDIARSINALNHFLPISENTIASVAKDLELKGCDLIVSDISPLGITVAKQLGIPSLLIENFTWDWIYRAYEKENPEFGKFADYLEQIYSQATLHILAEPFCQTKEVDLVCSPLSRKPRDSRAGTRNKLNVKDDQAVVIVSMGGIESKLPNHHKLKARDDIVFLIPGSGHTLTRDNNVISFPHKTDFYHPDLIQASDVVISKIGYSTLSEIYYAGHPFGYIPRIGFRESKKLEQFVQERMAGIEITETEYRSCDWILKLDALLALPQYDRQEQPGAEQATQLLLGMIQDEFIS